MTDGRSLHHQKSGKVSFAHVYDLRDPRGYFNTLGKFDYSIAGDGQRLFRMLLETRKNGTDDSPACVVDVCCSYGINAALLKHHVTLDDLYERYGSEELRTLSDEELAVADAEYYGSRRRENASRVVGVDVASNAVSYGLRAGLLDAGAAENLEDGDPSEALRREVSRADLMVVTGGVGYISGRTFGRLLDCCAGRPTPWVAAFALRWVRYEEISSALSGYGLVTESLGGHTFRQRRFVNDAEREYALTELAAMGIDPEGKESEGYYHANFYLSRPREQVLEKPVHELLEPVLEAGEPSDRDGCR